MENLRAAFQAAGAISASDCVKLAPFSRDDPAAQVAAFKAAHPALFYAAPLFDARTATKAEVDAQMRDIQRQNWARRTGAPAPAPTPPPGTVTGTTASLATPPASCKPDQFFDARTASAAEVNARLAEMTSKRAR